MNLDPAELSAMEESIEQCKNEVRQAVAAHVPDILEVRQGGGALGQRGSSEHFNEGARSNLVRVPGDPLSDSDEPVPPLSFASICGTEEQILSVFRCWAAAGEAPSEYSERH